MAQNDCNFLWHRFHFSISPILLWFSSRFFFDSIRFVPCALISIKLCVIRSVIHSGIHSGIRHVPPPESQFRLWDYCHPWSRWESLCALSQCQHNEKLFLFFLIFCTFSLQFLLLHFGLHLEALSDIDSPRIALNQTESHWILRH